MSKKDFERGAFQQGLGSKAGGFVAKKFFHPSSHRNKEKMWKWEMEQEETRKKDEELQLRREEERKMEELRASNAMLGQGGATSSGAKQGLHGGFNSAEERKNYVGGMNDMYSHLERKRDVAKLPPEQRLAATETAKRIKKMREEREREEGVVSSAAGDSGGVVVVSSAGDSAAGSPEDSSENERAAAGSKGSVEVDQGKSEKPGDDLFGQNPPVSSVKLSAIAAGKRLPDATTTSSVPAPKKGGNTPRGRDEAGGGAAPPARPTITSSLYKEDALESGHAAVFGSFFANGRWGYACCHFCPETKAERKAKRCPHAEPATKKRRSPGRGRGR